MGSVALKSGTKYPPIIEQESSSSSGQTADGFTLQAKFAAKAAGAVGATATAAVQGFGYLRAIHEGIKAGLAAF